MKTREEVEKLKTVWKNDPIYDLYDVEGFEEYHDELKEYQLKCEAEWKEKCAEKERKLDEDAEKLGISGLYRMILNHKELLDRHSRAIEALAEGDTHWAYKILSGTDD